MTNKPKHCSWCGSELPGLLALLNHVDAEHLTVPVPLPANVRSLADARRARRDRGGFDGPSGLVPA